MLPGWTESERMLFATLLVFIIFVYVSTTQGQIKWQMINKRAVASDILLSKSEILVNAVLPCFESHMLNVNKTWDMEE
mgnify:CR=1 FL=1